MEPEKGPPPQNSRENVAPKFWRGYRLLRKPQQPTSPHLLNLLSLHSVNSVLGHLPGGKSRERRFFFRRARSKVFSRASLGLSLGPLLASLVLPCASLGFSKPLWGSLWLSWGPLGSLLAPSWPLLGRSWAALGLPWAALGPLLASLGPPFLRSLFLVPFLDHFLCSFGSNFGCHFLYLFVPFSGYIFGTSCLRFFDQFWGSFSVLFRTFFGVHFWNQFFTVF